MKILYNRKQTSEKKNLIKVISELIAAKPKYLGVPNMVYQIGPYQVDKDGNLIAPDNAEAMELVEALKLYGYEEETSEGEDAEAEATTVETENTVGNGQTEVAEETEVAEKIIEKPVAATEVEAEQQEATREEPTVEMVEYTSVEEVRVEVEPVTLSIAFPLSQHTSQSIRNLVNLIFSRGTLVGKAVQGKFTAPKELVKGIADENYTTAAEEIGRIKELEAQGITMKGVKLDEDKVVFTGFPETSDADTLMAFQHMAEKMNRQAIEQKRIQAKVVNDENEKYSMRTWLVRIGMGGSEYKKTRKILMEHLDGHTAFKTQADADRWKAKQAALKAARKAAQEAEQCLE